MPNLFKMCRRSQRVPPNPRFMCYKTKRNTLLCKKCPQHETQQEWYKVHFNPMLGFHNQALYRQSVMSIKGTVTNNSSTQQDDNRETEPYTIQAQEQPSPESPEGTAMNNSTALQVAEEDTKCYTNDNFKSKESSGIAEIVNNGIFEERKLGIMSLISILGIVIIINVVNIIRGHKVLLHL